MSGQTWARHYQSAWETRAGDATLPRWLRVAALAYGRHGANGHATFPAGGIAQRLAEVDPTTGELLPWPRQRVSDAIRLAVEHGFLAAGSGSRCLVVPAHAIEGGKGNQHTPCPVHQPTNRRRRTASTGT